MAKYSTFIRFEFTKSEYMIHEKWKWKINAKILISLETCFISGDLDMEQEVKLKVFSTKDLK